MKKQNDIPPSGYRIGKLTILEIMAVLAVIGVLATWVLRHFFAG
jgi:prepilin-type N-terminal cleavage/methylation domain-containing protein